MFMGNNLKLVSKGFQHWYFYRSSEKSSWCVVDNRKLFRSMNSILSRNIKSSSHLAVFSQSLVELVICFWCPARKKVSRATGWNLFFMINDFMRFSCGSKCSGAFFFCICFIFQKDLFDLSKFSSKIFFLVFFASYSTTSNLTAEYKRWNYQFK